MLYVSDTTKPVSGGVIVGAVIGGLGVIIVILVVILALVLWITVKKRQKIRYTYIRHASVLHCGIYENVRFNRSQ